MLPFTFDVRSSWDAALVGVFTLGTSEFAGTDMFSPAWTFGDEHNFTGVHDDLSGVLVSVSWGRGRNSLSTRMLAGQASVTILDPSGTYNPANPTSPLAGQLLPMRPFYIDIVDNFGVTHHCFSGFLRDEPSHDATLPATTTFDLIDLFEALSGAFPVIAATGPTTTGAAIRLILATVGLTAPSMLVLDVGDIISNFSLDGSVSALQAISALLDAEQGTFYIDGAGRAVYRDRYYRSRLTTPVATYDGVTSGFAAGTTAGQGAIDNLVNRQNVNGQVYSDEASAGQFDWRDGNPVTTAYLNTAASAAAAERIVRRYGKLRTPLSNFTLDSGVDPGNLSEILARELNDRIAVNTGAAGPTTAGGFFIESLAVKTVDGGLSAAYMLSERLAYDDAFLIGTSELGSTDPFRV